MQQNNRRVTVLAMAFAIVATMGGFVAEQTLRVPASIRGSTVYEPLPIQGSRSVTSRRAVGASRSSAATRRSAARRAIDPQRKALLEQGLQNSTCQASEACRRILRSRLGVQ